MEAPDDYWRLLMRFIQVTVSNPPESANILDPDPYLRRLPDMADQLPIGARAFATDRDHYDFASVRCVKDLRLKHIVVRELGDARLGVEIAFNPNEFKHSEGLTITYERVTSFIVDVEPVRADRKVWPDSLSLGDVQLDEILPHEFGCSHEIKMTGGTIMLTCQDLTAEWGRGPASTG